MMASTSFLVTLLAASLFLKAAVSSAVCVAAYLRITARGSILLVGGGDDGGGGLTAGGMLGLLACAGALRALGCKSGLEKLKSPLLSPLPLVLADIMREGAATGAAGC